MTLIIHKKKSMVKIMSAFCRRSLHLYPVAIKHTPNIKIATIQLVRAIISALFSNVGINAPILSDKRLFILGYPSTNI